MLRWILPILAAVGLLVAVGCSSESPAIVPTAEPANESAANVEPTDKVEPASQPEAAVVVPTVDYSDDAIKSHLATKLLEVGTQRVAFLLSTNKALVKAPHSRIVVSHQQGTDPVAEITADYNEWPYGVRGSYSTPIEFAEPGEYLLTVTPIGGDVEGDAASHS